MYTTFSFILLICYAYAYRRNVENLNGWDKIMNNNCEVLSAIYLFCSETEMKKRIMKRGLLSGRSDDKLDVIAKRFDTFSKETIPVLNILEKKGSLISICADFDENTVYDSVKNKILTLGVQKLK